MFFLLRTALVIGAIFYFSPLRQDSGFWNSGHGEPGRTLSLDRLTGAASLPSPVADLAEVSPARLEAAWNALPESARQALLDKLLPSPAAPPARPRVPQTDTLLPEDHRPAWIGGAHKPGA